MVRELTFAQPYACTAVERLLQHFDAVARLGEAGAMREALQRAAAASAAAAAGR